MGHRYLGVNLDKVQPVANIRDHAYMLDMGHVMMIWANPYPELEGYNTECGKSCDYWDLCRE